MKKGEIMKTITGVIAVSCMLATTAQAQTNSPYSGTPTAVPGTLEAEFYDNGGENIAYHDTAVTNEGGAYRASEGVDIEICTDSGGGYNVGWTEADEWLKYTVNVAASGAYTITSRVASGMGACAFHIEVDDVDVTGSIPVPYTGGWQEWTNKTSRVTLTAGEQVVKIVIESGGMNINYLEFVEVGPAFTVDPIVKTNATENVAYAGQTVADAVTNADGYLLSYSLVPGGPAWLSVATNGALSGTPGNDDVGPNTWTLQVSDDKGRSDTAALNITVIDWELSHLVVDPTSGPFAGGNLVAISGLEIGVGSDVTNVTVGGVSAAITGSTSDRVTITVPGGLSSGVQNIVFNESISLEGAYTVNPAGIIYDSSLEASLNLSSLNGTNGFVINGIDAEDHSSKSVSGAGDVNGDGLDDLLIGAEWADPNGVAGAGESYVVYGSTNGFSAALNPSLLNGTNGFVINGIDEGDNSGISVSGAGDVNGDGLDDLLIRAYVNYSPDECYVVYGSTNGTAAALNLSSLNGTNGFVINGIEGSFFSSTSVSGAGDVNVDGFDDLLIGASTANSSVGASYVVYGSANGFSAALNISSLNGTNGFVINGIDRGDCSGNSVSGAGDVNGDGLDDLLIGAPGTGNSNTDLTAGKSYVVYGSLTGFSAAFNLSSLNGTNGFVINGIDEDDFAGGSVSGAGDVNGDGLDDLLIGAVRANSLAGESYVVYGSTNGTAAAFNLSSLNGTNGFVINGIDSYDYSGVSVSGAGDVNGDGLDDLLIGAYASSSYAGESYLVYGSPTGFSASLNLSSLNGTNGFVINGVDSYDYSGRPVSGAGDVNGDGLDDLLIGALGADPNGNSSAGESYVVYGAANGGVSPASGVLTGGYQVTITGINLGDGSDITNVTLNGASVTSIDSQSSTQIVVTAAPGTAGIGDVVVYSTSYGTTTKAYAFTYTASTLSVLGINGAVIVSGDATLTANGTALSTQPGASVTNTFFITNSGDENLILLGHSTNGVDSACFEISGVPASVAVGGVSPITVVYSPSAIGGYSASVVFTNNSPNSLFTLNLSGSCYDLDINNGPKEGGNTITITLDNSSIDITNVTVGGVAAIITGQTASSVTLTLSAGTVGVKDIVVQSTAQGSTTFVDAYTVNPAGWIGVVYDPQKTIAGGYSHSLALKTDGTLVGWGNNSSGQTNCPAGNNYVAVAAGASHSLALKTDGTLVGWGSNAYGQTTVPAGSNYVAVVAGYWHSLALKTDGTLIGWGRSNYSQTSCPAGSNYVAVAGGGYHSLALKSDGTLAGWGRNSYGEATVPAGSNYVAVAAGEKHSLALKTDGTLVGWGYNGYGQTTVPAGSNYVAVAAGFYYSLALKTDGTLIGWGRDNYSQASCPAGGNYVVVAAGSEHSLALKSDGTLVGWGYNAYGQTSAPPPNAGFGRHSSGVSPSSGPTLGGTTVTITGTNLCNGSDITNVTLCGVAVTSIDSQSSTQIVVTAASGTAGTGDVVVYSTSYGTITKTNAFTYLGPDLDDDGLPDEWEEYYFSSTTNANPNALCSNGVNTVLEAYVAGLDPTSPNSLFLASITDAPFSCVSWNAVSGRVYSIEWTTNLLDGFQPLETNIPWTQGSYTNQTPLPREYYKIEVRLEP